MARVVQQRTSPPYLLIVMVFLFLIAATVAVLMYLQADKLDKQLATNNATMRELADSDDLRDDQVRQMRTWYNDPPPGEQRGKTAIKRMQDSLDMLTQMMTGQATAPQVAMDAADAAFEEIGSRRGLVNEINDLHGRLQLAQDQIAAKDQIIAQKDAELQNKQQTLEDTTADMEARMAALNQQAAELDQKLTQAHEQYQADLEAARTEWERQRAELDRTNAQKTQVIQELELRAQNLDSQVKKLQKRLQLATRPEDKPIKVAQRSDGRILELMPEDNLCYINLGEKDRISPGLTFTVYPPTGIPEDGEGKGTVVVTNVGETTSECRIQGEQLRDPIVVGDIVANLAFDPTQVYTFVVEGEFDLYGTGRATSEGTDQVKALIRRFGGSLAEQVSIDTDFIVLGSEPIRPSRPAETAPPQVRQAYQDNLRIFERYSQIRERAENLNIPILNTSRFLAFIGYQPTQAGG